MDKKVFKVGDRVYDKPRSGSKQCRGRVVHIIPRHNYDYIYVLLDENNEHTRPLTEEYAHSLGIPAEHIGPGKHIVYSDDNWWYLEKPPAEPAASNKSLPKKRRGPGFEFL